MSIFCVNCLNEKEKRKELDRCYILLYSVIEGGTMKIIIVNGNGIPIYEQIKNAIKAHIFEHENAQDMQLPSIRELSRDLQVSILTVKKAYDELEAEGFIIVRQGLGSFVAPKNAALAREKALTQMEEKLLEAVKIALRQGIEEEEMKTVLELLYRGEQDGR